MSICDMKLLLASIGVAALFILATGCSQFGGDVDDAQQQQLQRSMAGPGQQSAVIPDDPTPPRDPVPGEIPDGN